MSPALLRTITGLFFLSGAIGLVYEVVWAKLLGATLGHTGLAHAVVLATFMGGLALGNALLGRLADRAKSQLYLYGWIEIGVGLFAALSPALLAGLSEAYVQIARATGLTGGGLLAAKIAVAALALLPPTILMGGTLPALGRFTTRSMATMQASIARLYFLNSFGAVAGCLVAGFLWIPAYGLDRTLMIGAVLNVAVGVAAIGLSKRVSEADAEPAEPAEAGVADDARIYGAGHVRLMLMAVTLSGVVSLAFEVAWIRLLSLVLGSSAYSFSLMLAAFVGGIATGSWLVHRGWVPGKDAFRQFGWAQAGIALSVLITLPFYDKLPLLVMQLGAWIPRTPAAFYPFEAFKFTVCFVLMLVPATCIGMTLPLATRVVTRAVGEVGTRVGAVFSLNTLGNVVGALSAALLLLPWLGLRGTILAGVGVNVLLAGAMLLAGRERAEAAGSVRRLGYAAGALAAFALYVVAVPGWDMRLLDIGAYRQSRAGFLMSQGDAWSRAKAFETLFHRDDASATITVGRGNGDMFLSTNGKVDASVLGDSGTQKLLGHLPLMLRPSAQDVLVVGLGSGMTAGSVLMHPVSALDVVEISEGVVEANPLFAEANHRPLEDPRTRLHVEDAGSFLRLTDRRYDVVISEPSNPWVAGIGNLFSAEFYQESKRHLKPGGLMVQWFHTYEIDDPTFQLVLRTFGEHFKHVTMWQIQQTDVMLVGSNEPITVDEAHVAKRLAVPAVGADFASLGIRRLPSLLAMQMASDAGVRRMAGVGPINTELRPILEYQAPKAFFLGATTLLPYLMDERLSLRRVDEHALMLAIRAGHRPMSSAEWQELVAHRQRWFTQDVHQRVTRMFLEAWMRAEPASELPRWEMVNWLKAQNEPEAALLLLEGLLAKNPQHAEYLDVAVDLEFTLMPRKAGFLGGDAAAYRRMKSRVASLSAMAPEHADDLDRRLGAIAFASGHLADGYASVDRTVKLAQPRERLALWMVAAKAGLDGGDFQGAARYLRQALAQDANYAPALALGAELTRLAPKKPRAGS